MYLLLLHNKGLSFSLLNDEHLSVSSCVIMTAKGYQNIDIMRDDARTLVSVTDKFVRQEASLVGTVSQLTLLDGLFIVCSHQIIH